MRFIVFVRSNDEAEAGAMPDEAEIAAMLAFNEELVSAGVLLGGEGLHPSSAGARLRFSGGGTTVIDGPFGRSGELVAGYWIIQAKSLEEAKQWMRRMPQPAGEREAVVEIRQIFDADDFGEALTPELREQEAGLRAQSGA